MNLAKKTKTGISRILDQARYVLPVAGPGVYSCVLSERKQAATLCRQRADYTRQTPKSLHALVRQSGHRIPTLSSRPAGGFRRPDVRDVNPHLQRGTLEGGLPMREMRSSRVCDGGSCPDVSSQRGEEAMAEDNVKGGDYRMAGRMALLELHSDKVRILQKGGR